MNSHADAELDARNLPCPMPLLRAKRALAELAGGQVLLVLVTDEAAPRDFEAYAKATGHVLASVEYSQGVIRLFLQKRED